MSALDDFDYYFMDEHTYNIVLRSAKYEFIPSKPRSLHDIVRRHDSRMAFELFKAQCGGEEYRNEFAAYLRELGFSKGEIVDMYVELWGPTDTGIRIKEKHEKTKQEMKDLFVGPITPEWVEYFKTYGLSCGEIAKLVIRQGQNSLQSSHTHTC